jgi:hypothetical protein
VAIDKKSCGIRDDNTGIGAPNVEAVEATHLFSQRVRSSYNLCLSILPYLPCCQLA